MIKNVKKSEQDATLKETKMQYNMVKAMIDILPHLMELFYGTSKVSNERIAKLAAILMIMPDVAFEQSRNPDVTTCMLLSGFHEEYKNYKIFAKAVEDLEFQERLED